MVEKVLSLIFWAKHQLSTTHFGRLAGARDWAKIEEMLKEMKMWLDAKESLAQMSEDSKMKNGLRGQMMQLDTPKLKKRMEEIRNGNS